MRPPRRECSAHWDSANVFCCSAGTAATSASGVCAKTLGTGLRTTLVYHKVLEEFLHDDHLLILRKGLKAAAIWQRAASALRQRVDRTLLYSREVNRVFTLAVWVPPGVVPRQGAGGCSRVFFVLSFKVCDAGCCWRSDGSPSPPRFSNLYGTPYGTGAHVGAPLRGLLGVRFRRARWSRPTGCRRIRDGEPVPYYGNTLPLAMSINIKLINTFLEVYFYD